MGEVKEAVARAPMYNGSCLRCLGEITIRNEFRGYGEDQHGKQSSDQITFYR